MTEAPPLNIVLLIGQSNMAGRGNLGDVPALHHPDIYMYRDGQWVEAQEPLHTDKPSMAGIGLGMSFAMDLVDHGDLSPVGLVPCAVGGTPLARWEPGGDLYESAVKITKCALNGGTLAGILWHQGEGDSGEYETAVTYGSRLKNMITTLRSELNAETVPVVTGELGEFLKKRPGLINFPIVNKHLYDLKNHLPSYACASAVELKDKGDNLHFDAASLREFGHRYAAEFRILRDV